MLNETPWKMKNDFVYRISLLMACLLLFSFCFALHILPFNVQCVCGNGFSSPILSANFLPNAISCIISLTFHLFLTTTDRLSLLMCSNGHTFVFSCMLFRDHSHSARDRPITQKIVGRTVDAIEVKTETKRNQHIWHDWIVNLFIRIHPFDMLINVQCLQVECACACTHKQYMRNIL